MRSVEETSRHLAVDCNNLQYQIYLLHTYRLYAIGILTYLLAYLLTYSLNQSPSCEADWFSASQEIPRILWNPNVHYHIHLSESRVRSIQSMPPHPTSWRFILMLSSHLLLSVMYNHFYFFWHFLLTFTHSLSSIFI